MVVSALCYSNCLANVCFSHCCHPESKYLLTQTCFLFFCLHQPLFRHNLWDSSCSHAIASENAGDAPQSSALFPLREKAVKSSLSTQTTSSLDEYKHTVNKMIHQLENRDGQSGEYCQATCGFASSTRVTESPVEAPTNNSIINVYKRFVLDKARKE